MCRLNQFSLLITLTAILVSIGCQDEPSTPDTSSPPVPSLSQDNPVARIHQCLGFYSLAIDTENYSVEFIPLRTGEWHFNLTGILNATMGVSAAMVPGESDPLTGLFVLDVGLTHPFSDKEKFTGFDVKGILMAPGTLPVESLVFSNLDETRLENADGYTRWWNPTEFTAPGMFGYTDGSLTSTSSSVLTATVNPYKLFADILGPVDSLSWVSGTPLDDDQGRAVFTAGSSNTRRYEIRFPMDPAPQIVFGYAIDCSWSPPIPNPPVEIPDNFPIEANQPEACRVVIDPQVNNLYYDSDSGIGGGVLRLLVNVHDWQGQDAGDIPSDINTVRIFAPGLMPGGVVADFLNETPIKARYTVDLTGTAIPPAPGEYGIICEVESSDGSTYMQTLNPAPIEPLASYQVISFDIPDPECAADSNNLFINAVGIDFGGFITDQVCSPDDMTDFYSFNIDLGYEAVGFVYLYSDAGPVKMRLYDESENFLTDITTSGNTASFTFDNLNLLPGLYYIEVIPDGPPGVRPYFLELDGELVNVTPSNPVDVTPSDLYVNPTKVWIHNNMAFLVGRGVWVYDISNPANPIQLSHDVSIRMNTKACFRYPYCYIVNYAGGGVDRIDLVDFSDPYAPVLHEGVLTYATQLSGICMNSTNLYVTTKVNPISAANIYDYAANPTSPVVVGSFSVPYDARLLNLLDPEGIDTHLVVGTWHDILTYDVENPVFVTQTGTFSMGPGAPRDIATWGDYIYVAHDVSGGGEGWLYVLRQTTVPNIVEDGTLDIPGHANNAVVDWPYVYVGDGSAGMTIADVTNPLAPNYESSIPTISVGTHLAVDNDVVYIVPMEAGLQVIDVSDPTSPIDISRLRVVNKPGSMVVKDDYLIVTEGGTWHFGIKTVDISDPSNARVVAEFFPPEKSTSIILDGNNLVAKLFMQWALYDVTDPLNITQSVIVPLTDHVRSMAIRGNAFYVAFENVGGPELHFYDISVPNSPTPEGFLSLTNNIYDISFKDDYMYLNNLDEILVYSLADPFNPVYEGDYGITGVRGMDIRGDYLHLVKDSDVEIADISIPGSPVFSGSAIMPVMDLYFITVIGQFGYYSGMDAGPYSCWVWPPDNPAPLGPVHTVEYRAHFLLVDDGFLYSATELAGIRIYDLY